jgi:hypothetical protein
VFELGRAAGSISSVKTDFASALSPNGAALSQPRASRSEHSEERRSPGCCRNHPVKSRRDGPKSVAPVRVVPGSDPIEAREPSASGPCLVLFRAAPLGLSTHVVAPNPGLRQYSLRSHCLALGCVRNVPSGLRKFRIGCNTDFLDNTKLAQLQNAPAAVKHAISC